MKKFSITILFVFLISIVALIFARNASAHATPILYTPEAASVVDKLPEQVSIKFSERIEQNASSITVYGPDGSSVGIEAATVNQKDNRLYSIYIKDAGQGTYTVSWQVVSEDDGHFTKGAFAFSVGKASANTSVSQIQIQHITTLPQAVTIGIELVGQAIILGVLFFLLLLWRPLKKKFLSEINSFKINTENRLSFLFILGAVLVIIGAALFIMLKTFDLQQLRPGDYIATLKIFLGTVDGSHAVARGLLSLLSIPLFLIFRKSIFKNERITKVEIALIAFLSLMLISRARVSHAAASHFLPWFSIGINALQLLFKEIWVGGLIVFCIAFLPFLKNLKDKLPLSYLSTSFSKLMSIAFSGIGVTGAYIVWLHLKDPAYLFSTEWGSLFIVLSLFGGALLLIRLYHQFLVDKRTIALASVESDIKSRLTSWSGSSFPLEMLVGIMLLFVTSLMIITTPPYATLRYNFIRNAVSNDAEITMAVHPNESSNFLINVRDAKKHTEIPITNMVITITNAEKNIGPIVVNTEERFPGGYVFPESLLAPMGDWTINITAQRESNYDAVASFKINYPADITNSRIDPDIRHFGWFEVIVILSALFILLLSYFMYRFSEKQNEICEKLIGLSRNTAKENETTSVLLSYLFAFLGLVFACAGIWFVYGTFVKTDFQKLCEKNGHFWLQSIPMKDGVGLSSDTVTGCFLDVGLYHFADKREYEFFYHKRDILPVLTYTPTTPVAGVPTEIMLSLNEAKDGVRIGPATELGINHDRILHILVVGEDLKTFAHIHTEDIGPVTDEMKKSTNFPLRYTFPKAGRYALNIDYVVSGIEYTNVLIVNVAGSPKMIAPSYNPVANGENKLQTKEFDGYQVTFTVPKIVKAGEEIKLKYYIAKDGKPYTDLEPYLGAAMHLGMIRNDLGRFFHTHGEASQPGSVWFQQLFGKYVKYHMHFAPDKFGPKIITPPWATKFTTPGTYTIFGEFNANGKVIVTDFEVQVQ